MSAYIHLDEAERMLNKINEIGLFHENSKFLFGEVLSDLNKASAAVKLDAAHERPMIVNRIEDLRSRHRELATKLNYK